MNIDRFERIFAVAERVAGWAAIAGGVTLSLLGIYLLALGIFLPSSFDNVAAGEVIRLGGVLVIVDGAFAAPAGIVSVVLGRLICRRAGPTQSGSET